MTSSETSRAVAHLTIRPDWLAKRREDPLEPELPIVDPHHHLWDRPGNRYLLPDILADIGEGHAVRATVLATYKELPTLLTGQGTSYFELCYLACIGLMVSAIWVTHRILK